MAVAAKRVIRTGDLMVPIAHFSHGLRVGNEIHLGATAGTDRTRRLVGSLPGACDARAQAEQMYRNMALALKLLGGDMENVTRLKLYLTDWRDKDASQEAYREYFGRKQPSLLMVGTWGFPLHSAVIEADLTATLGPPSGCRHEIVVAKDARKALQQLGSTLAEVSLRMHEVVSINVTISDLRDYPALDEAFADVFSPPYPARTVSVAPLADQELRVAMEVTAVAGGGKAVEPRALHRLPGPTSLAMLADEHLFISAQPGVEASGQIAVGVANQTRAAWRRINAILDAADMDIDHVIRTNNWLTDWRSYRDFNSAYGEFVVRPYPPRTTIVAGLLHPFSLVQIETIAHRRGREATVLAASTEEDF
jgi:2-iminobutanoate/2-iminopropanoate deaminase